MYAPVVKHESVKILLTIAAKKNLVVKHLDTTTAFLHGDLDEEIFMKQPEGFVQDTKKVCKLQKSIYGLKQSAHAWYEKVSSILEAIGFKRGKADPCVYTKKENGEIMYILVYVDDIIIAHKSNKQIENIPV